MPVETKNPTANSNGVPPWTNPANAYTSNNVYASASIRGCDQYYYNYGFSLSGYTIIKVEVGIEFYCLANEGVKVRVSWDGGVTWSIFSNLFTLLSEDIIWLNFTSVTSWTGDKLSDTNLRVQVAFDFTPGGGTCFAPTTLITMADGSKKPITIIRLGEKIKTKNGIGTVIAKTVHSSIKGYALVEYKGVFLAPTHLIWKNNTWITLPRNLPSKVFYKAINIETDKGTLYANDILFHNIEKEPWTAYLDWIPVRVTYSEAPPPTAGFMYSDGLVTVVT